MKLAQLFRISSILLTISALALIWTQRAYFPYLNPVPVYATAGTATFSGGTGTVTAASFIDAANTAYLLDPASSGNSLITAGSASVSGNLVLNAASTIQTTNMQPLTIGSTSTGPTKITSGSTLQLQAGGTGTGSTGTGSIYFLDSGGTTRGRFDTINVNATGGTITYSGGYTIHTFTSSGTFTPGTAGNVEYLVVGGGGGGGGTQGGGGGAGGFRTGTGFAVTAQAYTVTVGGGGAGASSAGTAPGTNGSDSVFSSITSTGGGGGAGISGNRNGNTGGSGGGASGSGNSGAAGNTPSTSPSQGNNGGNGEAAVSGGGGGAGAVGGNGVYHASSGNGGAGTASSISGASVTYAGGGGGGSTSPYTAGTASGGGGGGATGDNAGNDGTANTGGGGGGGGLQTTGASGGKGGSGIVIIRYFTYGTLYLGSTNTSSADLAEYYVTGDNSISAGDVVAISQNSKVKSQNGEDIDNKGVLMKADTPYDSKLLGIISTNPGVIMGSIDSATGQADSRQLALAGRVPVKIAPDSPAISIGDFLTSSATYPGMAQKATQYGYTVAKALENWVPGSGVTQIDSFVHVGIYDPDLSLTSTGDLKITADPQGNYLVKNKDNSTLKRIGVFAETVSATIRSGLIEAKQLIVDGVDIGKKLNELNDKVDQHQREIETLQQAIQKLQNP